MVVPTLAQLAALQGRFEAAANLVGYARARFAARSSALEVVDVRALAQAEALAEAALGLTATQALVQQGRTLEHTEAELLALGDAAASAG